MREDRFTDKVAFVTGAGQGMGQQFAVDLAAEGAKVVISDINSQILEETEGMLTKQGADFLSLVCDVTDYDQVVSAFDKTIARYGRVDILINNAGILKSATIEDTSLELIDLTIDVNIKGVLYCIKAATPYMKKQGYGKIVNLASITGKNGDNSTTFVYGASKGAVVTLTRSVARQLGPFGVNCNALAPHAVMTKMMAYWDDAKKKSMADKIPMRRLSTIKDVSNLALFLASDESSFITGETVNINGGYYMD
ncbi:MAG: glucose 1-dehydrogenase [Clostridia bacterium]|nr:glucose 1-dehydrogenase [Clostridia bacterium]